MRAAMDLRRAKSGEGGVGDSTTVRLPWKLFSRAARRGRPGGTRCASLPFGDITMGDAEVRSAEVGWRGWRDSSVFGGRCRDGLAWAR